uniref:Uncharacterized protein n=1 Tax=Opuntia streptacantha TaxID=393608 RepID=A0A7C9ALS1_OPUST
MLVANFWSIKKRHLFLHNITIFFVQYSENFQCQVAITNWYPYKEDSCFLTNHFALKNRGTSMEYNQSRKDNYERTIRVHWYGKRRGIFPPFKMGLSIVVF